jgi:uracil-DNA glycosylase family 4
MTNNKLNLVFPAFNKNTHTCTYVQGSGYLNSPIVVVGDSPESGEDIEAFRGKKGKIFRSAISGSGLEPSDVYYTNVMKVPITSKPTDKEFDSWVPLLKGELTFYFRDTIICVGKGAEYAVLQFARDNGIWVKNHKPQVYCVPPPPSSFSSLQFKSYVDMLSRIKHNTFNYSQDHVHYYKLDRQKQVIKLKDR